MTILRFELAGPGRQDKDIVESAPGGTGAVAVQVNIEPTACGPDGKAEAVRLLRYIEMRIESGDWP